MKTKEMVHELDENGEDTIIKWEKEKKKVLSPEVCFVKANGPSEGCKTRLHLSLRSEQRVPTYLYVLSAVYERLFFFDRIEVSPTPLKFGTIENENNPAINNFIDECQEFDLIGEWMILLN